LYNKLKKRRVREMEAYILIEVAPGKVKSSLSKINEIAGVECAKAVVGPYDIIAYVKTKDMKELGELVVSRIHGVEGVERTMTCIGVEL
jgi:DNA-binding Lrp family transcriptional regulator